MYDLALIGIEAFDIHEDLIVARRELRHGIGACVVGGCLLPGQVTLMDDLYRRARDHHSGRVGNMSGKTRSLPDCVGAAGQEKEEEARRTSG
jgi:hypothetical protein